MCPCHFSRQPVYSWLAHYQFQHAICNEIWLISNTIISCKCLCLYLFGVGAFSLKWRRPINTMTLLWDMGLAAVVFWARNRQAGKEIVGIWNCSTRTCVFTLIHLCSQRGIWVGQIITCEESVNWSYFVWPLPHSQICLCASSNRGLPTRWGSSTCEKFLSCLGSHLPVVRLSHLVQGSGLTIETVAWAWASLSLNLSIWGKGIMWLSCLKDL